MRGERNDIRATPYSEVVKLPELGKQHQFSVDNGK